MGRLGQSPLKEIRIELLQKCTLACAHCSADSSPSATRRLERPLITRLIEEGVELGLESVIFTGGEPLIDPDIQNYIQDCCKKDIRTTIFTSGFLPTKPVDAMIETLADDGLGQVNVSIYSMDAKTNAAVTRKTTSLEGSCRAIQTAVQCGLDTEVHFVPMAPNILELEGVATWAANEGATALSLLRYVPQGRGTAGVDRLAPAYSDELRLADIVRHLRSKFPQIAIRVGPSFSFLGIDPPTACTSGVSSMSIRSDGLVFPCDAFKGITDSFFLKNGEQRADLASTGLRDIWNGCAYLRACRAFIDKESTALGVRCGQGCPVKRLYEENLRC